MRSRLAAPDVAPQSAASLLRVTLRRANGQMRAHRPPLSVEPARLLQRAVLTPVFYGPRTPMTVRSAMEECMVTRLDPEATVCSFRRQWVAGPRADSASETLPPEESIRGCIPTEPVLCGLGACTAMTLRLFAQAVGIELGTISVSVTSIHDKGGARLYRHIVLQTRVVEEQRHRLAEVCERTPWTMLLKARLPVHTEIL